MIFMKTRFLKDKGWKIYEKAMDGKNFDRLFKKNMRKAIKLNSLAAKRAIRHTIKKGDFTQNAPLTIMIKKSNKPLIDTKKKIFKSINHKILSNISVWVGVLKTSDEYKFVKLLNDGGVIPVTTKMRNMFKLLWKVSSGGINPAKLKGRAKELWERAPGGWLPLNKSTKAIVIPSRPFIDKAFKDKVLHSLVKKHWTEATTATLHWMTKK